MRKGRVPRWMRVTDREFQRRLDVGDDLMRLCPEERSKRVIWVSLFSLSPLHNPLVIVVYLGRRREESFSRSTLFTALHNSPPFEVSRKKGSDGEGKWEERLFRGCIEV